MTESEHGRYDQIVRRMIETAGHTTQSLGVGRVLGQIYACLYFSPGPRSLNDLTRALGISKGSASMGVRQLDQWGALDKVWVKGDRKDYYQVKDTMGRIMRNAIADLAGKRLTAFAGLLDEVEAETAAAGNGKKEGDADGKFLKERIARLRTFQTKAGKMWDGVILRLLLK